MINAVDADKVDGFDSSAFFPGGNLPSGKTVRGVYDMSWLAAAANENLEDGLSFGFTLASAPAAHFIASGTQPPAECPGTADAPEAAPGHLCVYERLTANTTDKEVCSMTFCPAATRYGARVKARAVAAGGAGAWTIGTWAVTAL